MSLPRISFEEFSTDPQLCGFVEASAAQRCVMRVIDGLPPRDAEQRAVFESIAGRPWGDDLLTPRRIVALVMGVDSGKSVMVGDYLLHRALLASLAGLRPGQRGTALLVAPDTRLASIPLGYIRGIIGTSPLIRAEVESETADAIRFTRGTDVRVLPATLGGRGVRGLRYVGAAAEECAFFRDAEYRVNDQDVLRALLVRLLPGAQLVAVSTPWRQSGWLYDQYRQEFGRSRQALVLQAGTAIMRPDRSAADLRSYYESDAVMAASEIDAQFVAGVSSVFEAGDLEAVEEPGVRRREPDRDGWRYIGATDPSGLRNDPWAFTIIGSRAGEVRQFVVRSWRPGTAVETVVEEIRDELGRFGLRRLVSDAFGSEITQGHFINAGLVLDEAPFTSASNSPKRLGFVALRELVTSRRIRLLDDVEQHRELLSLEVHRQSGGGETIRAPGRLHDDRACALALACFELGSLGGRRPLTVGFLPKPDAADRTSHINFEAERERDELEDMGPGQWIEN